MAANHRDANRFLVPAWLGAAVKPCPVCRVTPYATRCLLTPNFNYNTSTDCAICIEGERKPMGMLPCGHAMCVECLTGPQMQFSFQGGHGPVIPTGAAADARPLEGAELLDETEIPHASALKCKIGWAIMKDPVNCDDGHW